MRCNIKTVFILFQNLYNFLAQPNAVSHLDISATDTMLESVGF